MPRRIPSKYISRREALRLMGVPATTLSYHRRQGNIRSVIYEDGKPGRNPSRYHVDDVRTYAWPGAPQLARAAGVDRETIYYLVRAWHMPGVERFGSQYRFNPRHAPKIIQWLKDGRPVRPPFTPREEAYARQTGEDAERNAEH